MQLSVYRRDNRKRNARRWRRRLCLAGSIAVLFVAAMATYRWGGSLMAGAASVGAFVRENPYFAGRETQVRGGENVGGSEIVAIAGRRHGMNMWKSEPADIARKISTHTGVGR